MPFVDVGEPRTRRKRGGRLMFIPLLASRLSPSSSLLPIQSATVTQLGRDRECLTGEQVGVRSNPIRQGGARPVMVTWLAACLTAEKYPLAPGVVGSSPTRGTL